MAELNPCRSCGGTKHHIAFAISRGKSLCSISCLDILCEDSPVVAYGYTQEKAKERAIKKWNRRAENESTNH